MKRILLPLLALLCAGLLGSAAAAAPAAPAEGADYVVIDGGVPYQPVAGKVEVAEVFGYTCPHCARFEAPLAAWARKLPAGARFVAIPAPFGGYWMPYARAYFAAQALGLTTRTHAAMFRALHEENRLPISDATPTEIATFYASYGVPATRFLAAYQAPAVDAQLKKASEFIDRSGVEGTPTLVVAGKYRVTARSQDDTLRVARWLVDRELAARRKR